jgi:probable phosphoglycerate mutase
MKKVYLIRHGESEFNVGSNWGNVISPLTELGIKQSVVLSYKFLNIPVETIISSTLNRAKETAKIISKNTLVTIKYSNLFNERRLPSILLDKPKNDPAALNIYNSIEKQFHLSSFRYSDEENFEDLKKRVKKVLTYLSKREEKNIVVITHSFLMRMILSYIIFDENLTGEECENILKRFQIDHCGIAIVTKENGNDSIWKLDVWNEVLNII